MSAAESAAPIRVFAPAKLNLYLDVIRRRSDGLHDIRSLIVFCDVGDEITISAATDLSIHVEGPFAAALGAENIAMNAARALYDKGTPSCGAEIRLVKNLPVGAGLGGGSSDAAATLKGLVRLWAGQDGETVQRIAAALGADVPACLAARPVVVGGVGDRVESDPVVPIMALALINPGVAVSTAEVYARCRPQGGTEATETIPTSGLADLVDWLDGRANQLTAPALAVAPEIGDVLEFLDAEPACLLARMSGSGATCFGIFADQESAAAAVERARRANARWWAKAAKTMTSPKR